ncbi:MAG: 4-hydroxy-tetrahydrodipicolinate reductase [Deltaproteobacteria bacterium]|nr:4-hydroxy-tetrahydrodipicolinate reductase [Deltaproteobacteria bacterium]
MRVRVGLNGAAGRMGRLLVAAVLRTEDLVLTVAADKPDHPALGVDVGVVAGLPSVGLPIETLENGVADAVDVFLDFSLPAGTRRLLAVAGDRPLVVGTTGLDAEARAALESRARSVPVVASPNFSTGIAILHRLVAIAAAGLPGYDVEVVETHHRAKADAPSGTALALARTAASARGHDLRAVHGRAGATGARITGEIGIHAVRGGDVVGEHRVLLAGPGEVLELAHRATSREAFVGGALVATRWVIGRAPGLYDMSHVLSVGEVQALERSR